MKISNIFLASQGAATASPIVGIELDDQALESVSGGCASSTFNGGHGNYGHPDSYHEQHGFGGYRYHQPFHPCPPPCPPHHQKRCY